MYERHYFSYNFMIAGIIHIPIKVIITFDLGLEKNHSIVHILDTTTPQMNIL